jgi:hypothetical protein
LTLTLVLSRPDAGALNRTIRAWLKWTLRSWGIKCERITWEDE